MSFYLSLAGFIACALLVMMMTNTTSRRSYDEPSVWPIIAAGLGAIGFFTYCATNLPF